MMKHKKERKKSIDEINFINNLKIYVNKYSGKTNFVKSVDFEEESNENGFRFIATIDCGSFTQRILYYPEMLFEEHFIDTEFQLEASEYTYHFYDIFNLFDIEDFELYYYKNLLSTEDVENAVKSIIDATESYLYYLEKAGTSAYLSDLEKNYETDMKNVYETEDWKEDLAFDDENFIVHGNHPVMSLADGKITDKVIKKLKKLNEKGKLDTIYEKRLLKYIEAGNKVDRKNIADNEEFEKQYWKTDRKIFIPIFILMYLLILAGYFIAQKIIFKGAIVVRPSISVFGVTIPYLREIGMAFLSALILFFGFETAFGKMIIKAVSPDELKDKMVSRFNQQEHGNEKPKRLLLRIAEFAVAVIVVVGFGFNIVANIGFYDHEVKFFDDSFYKLYSVSCSYEDIEIYKLDTVSVKDYEYEDAENAYAVSDGKGHYYEIGETEPNGEIEKKLFEIAEKYNKEFVKIQSVEELN